MGRLAKYSQISCAVNPACGREVEYGLSAALEKKSVMIVGGGIAGMEAARVATLRGHVVTLYEKSDRLGGVGPSLPHHLERAVYRIRKSGRVTWMQADAIACALGYHPSEIYGNEWWSE